MRFFLILLLAISFSLGCARMQVGGTKEPIKVDISMRLDVYQHVQKDIDAIESIVSGSEENKKAVEKQSLLWIFVREAYAQEALSPEVEQAALRRKDRLEDLSSWEAKGVIGENKNGLVEIRNSQGADSAAGQIVAGENADRMIIYQSVANKNGTSVEEVQKLYAKRLQTNAPAGTPVETPDGVWEVK
jgi:uncharacterized protein YdbL (DUF1318 family)